MNRTNSESALSSKAAEDRRTPRRWRVSHSRSNLSQVFECAAPAALKTHALETRARPPLTPPRARSVWSASDLSALSVRRETASGSWSQCRVVRPSGLSMNLVAAVPAASCGGVSPPARTPGETPGALAGEDACATSAARFMVPILAENERRLSEKLTLAATGFLDWRT